jgi:hypothetical protein
MYALVYVSYMQNAAHSMQRLAGIPADPEIAATTKVQDAASTAHMTVEQNTLSHA